MENLGQEKLLSPEEIKQRDLNVAIWKLSNDANPGDLYLFAKKFGIQEKAANLNFDALRNVQLSIEHTLHRIEQDLSYKYALAIWKALKEAGAMDEQTLKRFIEEYIKKNMNFTKEEAKRIEEKLGTRRIPVYDANFLEDFKKDLSEKIKEYLDWEINFNLK